MLGAVEKRQGLQSSTCGWSKRRGAVLLLTAFLMVFMMLLLALSVDVGYMMSVRSEMKRATDAAALAGAGKLIDGADPAQLQAFEFLVRNPVASTNLAENDPEWLENLEALMAQHQDHVTIETGHWDPTAPKPAPGQPDLRFTQSTVLPSAIRVSSVHQNAPFFFAHLFGSSSFDISSESVARYQPRDIALVLDFSGSMNDDSELKQIGWDGSNREVVEDSLLEIYQDLGSPSYGDLEFTPEYLTVVGAPPAGPQYPQITVTFQKDDVYVESTKDLSNVVLGFSDGTTQKIEPLSSPTGTFRGTGYNYYKTITKIWVKSGSNDSGEGPGYGERFEDNATWVKNAFGLNAVAYPYPSGSWDDFINYCRTNSNVNKAGYKKKYGHMNLINYWLEQKPMHSQTPDLWMGNAQPVGAVKDAVDVFMEYIQEVDTEDRAALVIYDSPSQEALVEHHLTDDFDAVVTTVQQRQAAHYDNYTNIGAGIRDAVLELNANARIGAFKMIVLMTDGQANKPSGVDAAAYALAQADEAAAKRYPIITISLGSGADTNLMQQIADRTGGVHFNIPGIGGEVVNYREQLLQVFRQIADDRPLVLVK
ncbi:MAG: VWA domain-containing protein [Pirellulales bacterium]|nr:VWA domain-containing protein [Pirellulales bacterium]